MKPAFALSLSQDGITLLHRKGSGWEIVGAVDPEAPGLDAAMADLRDRAAALEPEGFTAKLVLPKSQLLFTEARAPGPDTATRRSEIARALEGRTPYPVADLVFDWSGSGKTVKVAVVAKVTLEEAESFARHYGFNPVSFVGDPDGANFAGEPWFGTTASAGRHVRGDERVARDQDPVGLAGLMRQKSPATFAAPADSEVRTLIPASEPEIEEAGFIAVEDDDGDIDGGPPADIPADQGALAAGGSHDVPRQNGAPDVSTPEEESTPGPVMSPALPQAGPEASVTRGQVPELDSEDWLAPVPEQSDPDSLGGQAATALSGSQTEAAAAPDAPAFSTSRAAAPLTENVTKHLAGRATRIDIAAPLAGTPKLGSAISARDTEIPAAGREVPPQPARSIRPGGTAKSSSKALRRVLARAVGSKAPKPQLRHPRRSPEVEADELTVFGARRQARQRSRSPRLMGLFLTLALAFVMAAAVLWSMLFDRTAVETATSATSGTAPALATAATQETGQGTDAAAPLAPAAGPDSGGSAAGETDAGGALDVVVPDPNADFTPPADDPSQADPAPAASPPQDTAQATAPTDGASDATGTGDAAAEAAAAAAAASLAATSAATTETAPVPAETPPAAGSTAPTLSASGEPASGQTASAEPASGQTPPSPEAAPAAAATPQPGSAPQPEIAAAPAAGPSVWGEAADKSNAPASEDTGLVVPGMNEAAKTGNAGRLPDAQGLTQDPDPSALPQPVPFDKLVRYDPQGLIIPTPGGVVSPDGFTVFAGKPPVVAKPRPAGLKAIPEAVEILLQPVDPTVPRLPNPLSTKRPALRPDNLAAPVLQQGENTLPVAPDPAAALPTPTAAVAQNPLPALPTAPVAAPATATVTAPAADPRLAAFRPKDRPASVLAAGAAAEMPPVAPPADSRLAALKPKDRPAKILAAATANAEARAAIADAAQAAAGAEAQNKPLTAAGTRLAVATSLRPTERPSRLSQGVSAAVALAVATSVAEAAPAPELAAVAETVEAAPVDNTQVTVRGSAAVPEEAAVEKAQAAAPNMPSRASVAKEATIANVIDLGRVNLIGIYGSQSDRRAMVRLASGRYVKVKVGDALDGGRVAAIGDTQLSYVKSGRTIVLKMIRDS